MAKAPEENKPVHLMGAGGHSKVIIDILCNQFGKDIQIFIYDDDDKKVGNSFYFYQVIDKIRFLEEHTENCLIAIGDNYIRKKIARQLDQLHCSFITAIHPNSVISDSAVIEQGTVVMAGVVINANAHIGKHCILNTSSVIEHDCRIENFVHIAPSATLAGNVIVGEGTFIGANATVIPGIKIGKWSVIGAGSVVVEDIPDYSVAYGVPAKVMKENRINE
ncbi:MAG: acetyltransferase [Methanobacteriota archaeon]|nr:MAG: acetyltransferase [Euryarchaeota archaeon]